MPNSTQTLGLTKPLKSERYNVDVFNENADKIDRLYANDIEDLKAKTGCAIGDVVEVLGYYTKGDGGGHRRQKKPVGYNGVDAVIGADGSIWGIVHSGEVNVSWFGEFDFDRITLQMKKIIFDKEINSDIIKVTTTTYGGLTLKSQFKLENKHDLEIVFTKKAKIKDKTISYLNIDNCSNIKITNGNFTCDSNEVYSLYEGYGITVTNSTNVSIEGSASTNICGVVCVIDSNYISVVNCTGIRDNKTCLPRAYVGFYQSSNITIDKVKILGGGGDGDISIYGTCKNYVVQNCFLNSYLVDGYQMGTQGICIDGSVSYGSVSNNYVEGYFYGIDVKSNTFNNVVSNNTCVKNKVAIASRLGEIGAPTVNTLITSNTIKVNGGNGSVSPIFGFTGGCGVLINGAYGCIVENNIISNTENSSDGFIGIGALNQIDNLAYIKDITIRGNSIKREVRIGSLSAISTTGNLIVLENINDAMISNNYFGTPFGIGEYDTDIVVKNSSNRVNIINNQWGDIRNSKPTIDINGGSQHIISGNVFGDRSNKLIKLTSVSDTIIENHTFKSFIESDTWYINTNTSDNVFFKNNTIKNVFTGANMYLNFDSGSTNLLFHDLKILRGINKVTNNSNAIKFNIVDGNGNPFDTSFRAEFLDTPYHATQMSKLGILDSYHQYLTKLHEYENQKNIQPDIGIMNLNVIQPPVIPTEVEEYAKEYNLI